MGCKRGGRARGGLARGWEDRLGGADARGDFLFGRGVFVWGVCGEGGLEARGSGYSTAIGIRSTSTTRSLLQPPPLTHLPHRTPHRLLAPPFPTLIMLHNKHTFSLFLRSLHLNHPLFRLIPSKSHLFPLLNGTSPLNPQNAHTSIALKPVFGRACSNDYLPQPPLTSAQTNNVSTKSTLAQTTTTSRRNRSKASGSARMQSCAGAGYWRWRCIPFKAPSTGVAVCISRRSRTLA